MIRIYLAVVGLLYLGLAAWCSVDPVTTSSKVGLERLGDTGRSEYLVIYGGLELGMALIFLLPLFDAKQTGGSLWACFLIHVCLVLFRSISFFLYPEPDAMTWNLAIGEWIILISTIAVWWSSPASAKNTNQR